MKIIFKIFLSSLLLFGTSLASAEVTFKWGSGQSVMDDEFVAKLTEYHYSTGDDHNRDLHVGIKFVDVSNPERVLSVNFFNDNLIFAVPLHSALGKKAKVKLANNRFQFTMVADS